MKFFAVASPGIEDLVHKELSALVGEAQATQGGVEFEGSLETLYWSNLCSRTATRIVVRLGTFEAQNFGQLQRRLTTLPWKEFLSGKDPIVCEVATQHCRLYHTGAIRERVLETLHQNQLCVATEERPPLKVLIRGQDDHFTFSLDSSGELLHKRGWRSEQLEAPLRENLAAAILMAAGWPWQYPEGAAFFDGMCGSGTLAIEAALLAAGRAPGLQRSFAFERWQNFDRGLWSRLQDRARSAELEHSWRVFASDQAAEAVERTRRNAERAGVGDLVVVERADFFSRSPPAMRGLVLLNPPYGRRIGRGDPQKLYARILSTVQSRYADWRAFVLAPRPFRGWAPARTLSHGGLRVILLTNGLLTTKG